MDVERNDPFEQTPGPL